MSEITDSEKYSVYLVLITNIIISLIITSLLLFGLYDISILKLYQKIYLILSLLIWVCLSITYITKLIMVLYSNLIYKNLIVIWFSINFPALISLIIAFIYDMTQLFKRNVPLLLWVLYAVIIYFTLNDYYHIKLQVKATGNNENSDMKNLKYVKIE